MNARERYPHLAALVPTDQASDSWTSIDARLALLEIDRLSNLLEDALVYIDAITEGDAEYPCRFDHHGHCQTHSTTGEPGVCVVMDAYEFVCNVRDGWWGVEVHG